MTNNRRLYDRLLFDLAPPLLLLLIVTPSLIREQQHSVAQVWPLSLALLAPLFLRRRYPVVVFCAVALVAFVQWWAGVTLVAFVQWWAGVTLVADVALLVAFYTVASRRPLWMTFGAAAVLELGVGLAVERWGGHRSWLLIFVLLSGMVSTAGVLGVYARTRAAYLSELQERADRLERERDQQAQLAAVAERARIAREMHDIIAHHLTVMIALSEGAAAAVESSPDRAVTAMTTVSATGREALADTRRLLGVLREPPGAEQRAPQPDISRLDGLLEQIRTAGLPVTFTVTGTPRPLSAALQLTIYRLVQEALTNTLKHAGPGAQAQVLLSHEPDAVLLVVTDDGLGALSRHNGTETTGHGLAGMRERVAPWGGELRCGP
ncbi:MAG: sensor histidine kinase, partial [Mycobacteriaceae bacterium]